MDKGSSMFANKRPIRRMPTHRSAPSAPYVDAPNAGRVLVAISSCELYENNGYNQSLRDTWLPILQQYGWDYKFFHGKKGTTRGDIVALDCEDPYFDLTSKTKKKLEWSYQHGYDFTFCCFPDTYPCVERLVKCGYENFDYFGNVFQHAGGTPFCQGGAGYFLSRKANFIITTDFRNYPNEDCFVGDLLNRSDIKRGDCKAFCYAGPGPLRSNDTVTNHLSTQDGGFTGAAVLREHSNWKDSWV